MAYINKRKIGGLGVSIRGREQSPAIIAKQIQAILESVYDALDDVDASFGNINFYFSPYSGDGQKLAFLDGKGDLLGKFDCTSIFKPIDLSSLGISLVPVSKLVSELEREQEEVERRRELEREVWHEEYKERQRLLRQEKAELQVVRDIISKEFQVDRFQDVAISIGKLSASKYMLKYLTDREADGHSFVFRVTLKDPDSGKAGTVRIYTADYQLLKEIPRKDIKNV